MHFTRRREVGVGLGAGNRGGEERRKEAVTLGWLNIRFVLQTRAKFLLRIAPPETQSNSLWTTSCTQTTILWTRRLHALLNLVGKLRWESENASSALAPPTSTPPPGTRRSCTPARCPWAASAGILGWDGIRKP